MAKPKRYKPPELPNVDLIEIIGYMPPSPCPHGWDISRGRYCPVCDRAYPRFHPVEQRTAATDPKPEPRKTYAPDLPGGLGKLTAKPKNGKI